MRKYSFLASLALCAASFVATGLAQNSETDNPLPRHFPTKQRFVHEFANGGAGLSALINHGGPTIPFAQVIPIFWGSAWSDKTKPQYNIALSLQNYLAACGTTGEYNVITQYSGIQENHLYISGAVYDTSEPPTNVTDAALQAEVNKYFSGKLADTSTVYEVFLPPTSYSSDGLYTSCGGPFLAYCAYHSSFTNSSGQNVKYASMPYPSCGGCQSSGFSDTQNFEHFIVHETREAATDPNGTAWYDRRGNEADDKCAWQPTPFTDVSTGTNLDNTAFAYQYEWSNANSRCVQIR